MTRAAMTRAGLGVTVLGVIVWLLAPTALATAVGIATMWLGGSLTIMAAMMRPGR